MLFNIIPWYVRWGAILALTLAACSYVGFKVHAHDNIAYNDLNQKYASFRADVKAAGDIAAKQAQAQEARQQETTNELRQKLADADRKYADVSKRLRDTAPSRPDGSGVPQANCDFSKSGGTPSEESVPLTEYKALEDRAAYDALTATVLEQTLDDLVKAGVLVYGD